jgi:predicted Ser/Thr protein kinase
MPWALDRPAEDQLLHWIEASLADGTHRLGAGYQAQTLLYDDGARRLVIKAPAGRGLRRLLSRWMLRREARAYERLAGFAAAPRCHGLLRGQYLVLDYIAGEPARYAEIADREAFFAELLARLQELHARGVAHGDLQKKDNLWLVDGRHPLLLDFGAAIVRRSGFAPANHRLFRFVVQLDFNQWAKLKTRGRPDRLSAGERRFYRRTLPEKIASALKYPFRRIKVKERP